MKRTILSILAVMTALVCAASCSDPLKDGVVDLTPNNPGGGTEQPGGGDGGNEGGGNTGNQEFQYPAGYDSTILAPL